jgi:hypothetical protein
MQLPHNFKRILLHLARSKEHPAGSARHGYEIIAPLDGQGRFDLAAWRSHKPHCRVRRFVAGEPDQNGLLIHRSGGPKGVWGFDYDTNRDDDDESGYRLGDHAFVPGEYVSVRDDEGVMHTYRVISVNNAA